VLGGTKQFVLFPLCTYIGRRLKQTAASICTAVQDAAVDIRIHCRHRRPTLSRTLPIHAAIVITNYHERRQSTPLSPSSTRSRDAANIRCCPSRDLNRDGRHRYTPQSSTTITRRVLLKCRNSPH